MKSIVSFFIKLVNLFTAVCKSSYIGREFYFAFPPTTGSPSSDGTLYVSNTGNTKRHLTLQLIVYMYYTYTLHRLGNHKCIMCFSYFYTLTCLCLVGTSASLVIVEVSVPLATPLLEHIQRYLSLKAGESKSIAIPKVTYNNREW